ncbi:hypothetical protein Tco_0001081 [Tanacetum coccineum]
MSLVSAQEQGATRIASSGPPAARLARRVVFGFLFLSYNVYRKELEQVPYIVGKLVNGKTYDPPTDPNDVQNDSQNSINFYCDDDDEESTPTPKPQTPKPVKENLIFKPYKPKIPYPQRLRKEKMEAQYGKFLDMIRVVRINVPFVDVLAGMPNYDKFLKEIVSNKRKLEQTSSAFLSDESSAMIQNKVPPKLEDPGSFFIPCTFSKTFSCNALADLGARINLMAYSLYVKLSLLE